MSSWNSVFRHYCCITFIQWKQEALTIFVQSMKQFHLFFFFCTDFFFCDSILFIFEQIHGSVNEYDCYQNNKIDIHDPL